MATQHDRQGPSEFLGRLHGLSVETEEEILAMSREQIRERLAEEGIDLSPTKTQLASRMTQHRAQRRLAEARDRRLAQERLLADHIKSPFLNVDEMRAEISRRLGILPSVQGVPAPVQAYFNRFKEAADEDLPGLLEDLELLEKQNSGEAEGGG